jgi:pimeloyl-ACP methyl ester carboxylesterase
MPRIAGVEAEICRAESDKYAAPLLLLHGLWAQPRIWRQTAGYLAHRGWSSYLLSWRGAAGNLVELTQLAAAAAREIEAAVIGHDLGGLVALQLHGVRAAVAIAPPASGTTAFTHPLAGSIGARLRRWRGAPILPTPAAARRVLGLGAEDLVAENSAWLDEMAHLDLAVEGELPRLLMAGSADPCLPTDAATALARRASAELCVYEGGGHDLPYGAQWQKVADDLHRWLVRRLGTSILLLRGDEDLREEDT